MYFVDQDEAARSAGDGSHTSRDRAREGGPLSATGDEPMAVWASQVQEASAKVLDLQKRG